MKFFGQPNQLVKERKRKPLSGAMILKPLFRFDENGEYETSDEKLITKLKCKFRCEETKEIMPFEPESKVYKCKKCDFKTDNNGLLKAHYRKEHKKGDA
jgi:hypothetical protein